MKVKRYYLIILSLLLLTCKKDIVQKGIPPCLTDRINQIMSEDKAASPRQILSYSYKGQTVYFIPQRCCDIPSTLLDQNCNVLCAPDGGISGGGDGQCRDFFATRTDEKLVWQDLR